MSFLDTIGEFIQAHGGQLGGWVVNQYTRAFHEVNTGQTAQTAEQIQTLYGQALNELESNEHVPESIKALARNLRDQGFVVGNVAAAGLGADVAAAMLLSIHAAQLRLAEQLSNQTYRPELLTPDVLMELFRRGIETEGNVDAEMQAHGFRDTDIENMKELTRPLLDVDTVRNLFWRGTITATTADDLLSRLGYNETQRADVMSLFAALPSVDDHIRMAVRQVFNPELRQALGLDEDYPEALTPNIAKVGLSEEWARNIWAAHWQIPSPTQIFEMRFRGVIDETLQNQALRDAGYSPLWRDKLLQINQRLVTRVDGRRLFDTGIWDQARLQRHFAQLGYTDQDAADLAEWTVKNATEGDQLRKSRVKSLTEQMVTHALETYVIHADTARELLQGLNYTAEEIELLVSSTEYRRDQAAVKEVEAAVKHNYVRGQMDRQTATDQLHGIGLADDRVSRLLGAWDLLAQSTYLSEHAHHIREITKSDVLASYADNVMQRGEARTMLLNLDYPTNEVDLLLANEDTKIAKVRKKDQLETYHFQFVNGQINEHQVGLLLDAMNLRAGERDFLIAKWQHEAKRGTTQLTVNQLSAIFAEKIVNLTQVRAELSKMGYSTEHVDWLTKSIVGSQKVDSTGFVVSLI